MGQVLRILVISAAALLPTVAEAATYVGSTQGCFGTSCGAANKSSTAGLSFSQGTFNQNDSAGFVAIGSGMPPGQTLGLLTLAATPGVLTTYNTSFNLFITFNQLGSPPADYLVHVTGSVTGNSNGGVLIHFNNAPQLFTYQGGAFTLTVNELALSAGATNMPINGVIQSVPVPEPATWALMILGFGGIGVAMRPRRRPVRAQIA